MAQLDLEEDSRHGVDKTVDIFLKNNMIEISCKVV